ncbi:type IV secretory system conjugative DNA transfer family protein [Parvularcula marina]|uniref:Uncharacterized protein n=1 Tax=Parvularcula marina TaxID=2292771 RepID=A0A371RFR7_9PROT|nr:type IV secretory system conjugative DNA transfer family protein [Parvularcula marina]RFB04287.1 hypothetical protein DX908_02690 [Parvularcula marina]
MTAPLRGRNNKSISEAATAKWAEADLVSAHSYVDGQIWLGTIPQPTDEANALIEDIRAFVDRLNETETLNPAWRDARLREAEVYCEKLERTGYQPIGVGPNEDRHGVLLAATRSGKLTSILAQNLMNYAGSVLASDSKGELARLFANRRGHGSEHCDGLGQQVHVIDPYRVSSVSEDLYAGFNPLQDLHPDDPLLIEKAASIADMLIIRGDPKNVHFDDNARIFVKAVILFVVYEYQDLPQYKNLLTVRDLIVNGARAQMEADFAAREAATGETITDRPSAFMYLLDLMKEYQE